MSAEPKPAAKAQEPAMSRALLGRGIVTASALLGIAGAELVAACVYEIGAAVYNGAPIPETLRDGVRLLFQAVTTKDDTRPRRRAAMRLALMARGCPEAFAVYAARACESSRACDKDETLSELADIIAEQWKSGGADSADAAPVTH